MAALDGISTLAATLSGLNGVGPAPAANGTRAESAETAPVAPSSAAQGISARGQDQASVSSAGGLVAQALSTSDVRLDKVSALQAAIANGSYSVPSTDVASKIVDSLLK